MKPTCFVSWPSAPLTDRLVRRSLSALDTLIETVDAPRLSESSSKHVQWSSYDTIDHELTHLHRHNVLASSYTFRKVLIRKHFLSQCLRSYVTKKPTSILAAAVPKTFEIEISFADELEEMWADDIFELGMALENHPSWYILKPGMSDRGMGIRLFNSKDSLRHIFEEFELPESDSESEDENSVEVAADSGVAVSQLRHFVLQEYIFNPLLLDPREVPASGSPKLSELAGHKFHLRAYCLACGALQIYLYRRILALFSATPYVEPVIENKAGNALDLSPHITNTSLQVDPGGENVRLFEELVGCYIMSPKEGQELVTLTAEDSRNIVSQMADILGETFRAALQNPIHFQPCPNAFELYGVDFMVAYTAVPAPGDPKYQVKLLEFNAEPAIELTGLRLTWILEDLFLSIGKVCVEPFLRGKREGEEWGVQEEKHDLIKVLDEQLMMMT